MKILPNDAKEDDYELFYTILTDPKDDMTKKEIVSGSIRLRVRFLPAGKPLKYSTVHTVQYSTVQYCTV